MTDMKTTLCPRCGRTAHTLDWGIEYSDEGDVAYLEVECDKCGKVVEEQQPGETWRVVKP